MADDQVTDTTEAPDTAPVPEPAQAPDPAPVTETAACRRRSTYHWRHGGGGCPNPARWCQWCKDGGCVLARQADAARGPRDGRHGGRSRGRSRRRRRRRRHRRDDGWPELPLPPTVPFPMFPGLPPIQFPPLPCPMLMAGAERYRAHDVSDASSLGSSCGSPSDDER